MDILENYLTREQLAQALHVTTRTVSRWQDMPDGLPTTKIGGRVFFNIDSVKRWLESRERQANKRRAA